MIVIGAHQHLTHLSLKSNYEPNQYETADSFIIVLVAIALLNIYENEI